MPAERNRWQRAAAFARATLGGRVPGVLPDRVDTDELVYPRRYDIVMREKFVRFYRANREIYLEDRRSFAALARELPYYRFFTGIPSASAALRRRYPSEPEDSLFARKIDLFVALIESMDRSGFDRSGRIRLKYHVRGPARGSLSIGDGCHRLSVLRQTHGPVLEVRYFKVTPWLSSRVRDNTATLAAKGLLTDEEVADAGAPPRDC